MGEEKTLEREKRKALISRRESREGPIKRPRCPFKKVESGFVVRATEKRAQEEWDQRARLDRAA